MIAITLIVGKGLSSLRFSKEVATLFSHSKYSKQTSARLPSYNQRDTMGEANLETWIGKVSHYKEKNGMIIPFAIEAIYRLKHGDYS